MANFIPFHYTASMTGIEIDVLMTGRRHKLTPDGEESAIRKGAVSGPVTAGTEGLEGDEHAYHGHGGPDKAILHYAAEHYVDFARRFSRFVFDIGGDRGGFGENISTRGMTEKSVCLGDRYRIGRDDRGITVEVTGFRQPCWKLAFNCGVREVPRLMQEEGTPGWYYRVLDPGSIAAGDTITLLTRPFPEWPIDRLVRGFYGTPLDKTFMNEALAISVLGNELRTLMERRIATGAIEEWDGRLYKR
jgi:MOSC domain-containing protein YiiM